MSGVPAKSTIHAVLDRHGLVKHGGGPRHRARGTPLSEGARPNDLWCADFKGEFRLGNGRYCYPLTVTDHASRFLLMCEALESTREDPAITAFERLFRERGLPLAIRSDNGVPFASPNALVQPLQALGLVAPARHRHRAHQARPSAAERPPRAHAPHPQEGDNPAAGLEQPAAAGPLRRLRAASSTPNGRTRRSAMKMPRRTLSRLTAALSTACPNSPIRSTTATFSSPLAARSACIASGSTSRPCWPARNSASRKSTTAFGSSASCTTILDTSTWSRKPCNPSTTRSARGCHLCLRYDLLPMSPGWTTVYLAEGVGFEPTVPLQARRFSRPVP